MLGPSKSYTELCDFDSFIERFRYLAIGGSVGHATFGFDRYINQEFYRSREWKDVRRHVIVRDLGLDLGAEGHDIHGIILVHHMNPIEVDDFTSFNDDILNPEYLISTTHATHNALHYGDERQLPREYVARTAGDTNLW